MLSLIENMKNQIPKLFFFKQQKYRLAPIKAIIGWFSTINLCFIQYGLSYKIKANDKKIEFTSYSINCFKHKD